MTDSSTNSTSKWKAQRKTSSLLQLAAQGKHKEILILRLLLADCARSTYASNAAQTDGVHKEEAMKTFLKVTIATLMLALASMSWAQDCTNATIQGSYAFTVGGWVVLPNGYQQRDGVAMTQFDGQGNLTQVDWVMSNGQPMGGHTNQYGFHDGETGTYTVNPDCTGSAEIKFPPPQGHKTGAIIDLMFVVGDQGAVIHTVVAKLTPPDGNQPVPADIRSDAHRF